MRHHRLNLPLSQTGVALITALLIVALATLTAVSMSTRLHIDIRRSTHLLTRQQAQTYTLGAEAWARQILQRDSLMSVYDHGQELWALTLPPTPVDGGQLQGRLYDLNRQFNLNNLLDEEGEPDEIAIARLRRLLDYLALAPDLVAVMLDWIDADQAPTLPGGAEDNTYLLKTPAYRAANQRFMSLSELYLLHGMEAETVQQLRPYLTVLPTRTAFNVNTASAVLLTTLADELTLSQAEQLVTMREETPFKHLDDFLMAEALAGIAFDSTGLSVSSDYFLLHATAYIGPAQTHLLSVLKRDGQGVQVWRRVFNEADYQALP